MATVTDLHGCRVLLVEDETRIAMLLHDALEDIGCEVVAMASRLEEGFEKATSLTFDIALLDVDLNGQPSYPIALALADRGCAFLFATAYNASMLPPRLRGALLLQKPFMRRELERALRTVLGNFSGRGAAN